MEKNRGAESFSCPKCQYVFNLDELDNTSLFSCPNCDVGLVVKHTYHWLYVVVSLLFAGLVAYVQGLHSIVFAGAMVIYATVFLVIVHLAQFFTWIAKEVRPAPALHTGDWHRFSSLLVSSGRFRLY